MMKRWAGAILVLLAATASFGWYYHAKRDAFAEGRDAGFDADRAMGYLRDLCDIGPRISGSEGMKKQQDLLQKHFESLGAKCQYQRFTAKQKSQKEPVEMANLVVSWNPERQRRVIICSHYDTRPIADQEPDPRNWRKPFVSANDGGSGVALMMELAHHMKDLKSQVGVDFVFFDGEEYIFDTGTNKGDGDLYFFGSEHFAREYRRGKSGQRYLGAVLLDMIGGKGARFPVEQHSMASAGGLVQTLWSIAEERRCPAFVNVRGDSVLDDHIALNKAGIPAVDIIDFSYKNWHKLSDVPENCSGDSFAQVARVLVTWLERIR